MGRRRLSNQEIAEILIISERTVSCHVSNILEKLHLANRTQAACMRSGKGWLAWSDEQRGQVVGEKE